MGSFIWRVAEENATHLRAEFPPSALNVADAPSRCCGSEVHANEFELRAGRVPLPARFCSAFASIASISEFGLPTGEASVFAWDGPSQRC